jgi:hypothetical protein
MPDASHVAAPFGGGQTGFGSGPRYFGAGSVTAPLMVSEPRVADVRRFGAPELRSVSASKVQN